MSYHSHKESQEIFRQEGERLRELAKQTEREKANQRMQELIWQTPFSSSFAPPVPPAPATWGNEPPTAPVIDLTVLASLKAVEPRVVSKPMPDRISVITAWRAWGVAQSNGEWRLKSLGQKDVWEPKAMITATCSSYYGRGNHPAPNFDCECGVWAFKELDGLVSALGRYEDVKVLGNVSLWGRVIETENGYRAQYAYPSELWLMDAALESLGYSYSVPVRSLPR